MLNMLCNPKIKAVTSEDSRESEKSGQKHEKQKTKTKNEQKRVVVGGFVCWLVVARNSHFLFSLEALCTHCLSSPSQINAQHKLPTHFFFSVVSFHNFYSLRFQFHFICWTCKTPSSGKSRRLRGVFFSCALFFSATRHSDDCIKIFFI